MVSTGSPTSHTAAVAPATATSSAGPRGKKRFISTMTVSAPAATATAAGFTVARTVQSADSFSRKSAGIAPMFSPSRSRIWLEKMMTAMPAVKPVMTGSGMYLIQSPTRITPATTRMTPAIIVASASPS
jgi:hypothetical protein